MEAVTIAGMAIVAVGGYFSVLDFLTDAGMAGRVKKIRENRSPVCGRNKITPQSRIKKMAGMHI